MTMVCPITNTNRRHPFHVKLDNRTKTTGVIMCDQARMLDLGSCYASYVESVPEDVIAEATNLISGFIETIE